MFCVSGNVLKLFLLSSLVPSCVTRSFSNANVVNGRLISRSEFPQVTGIIPRNEGHCTGSFLGPRVLISAAHCAGDVFSGDSLPTPRVIALPSGPESVAVYLPPDYKFENEPTYNDIAIVVFELPQTSQWFDVRTEPVKVGEQIQFFGAGKVHPELPFTKNPNILRVGENIIDKVEQGTILFTPQKIPDKSTFSDDPKAQGSGEDASLAKGDSGGPVLIGGKLVGIISGILAPTGSLTDANSLTMVIADLNAPPNRKFLKDLIKNKKLDIPSLSGN